MGYFTQFYTWEEACVKTQNKINPTMLSYGSTLLIQAYDSVSLSKMVEN